MRPALNETKTHEENTGVDIYPSCNGSFTLIEADPGIDWDLDSKPDDYIALCRTFYIVQTWTQIPTPYFCIGQESESESKPESASSNVNEPLHRKIHFSHC